MAKTTTNPNPKDTIQRAIEQLTICEHNEKNRQNLAQMRAAAQEPKNAEPNFATVLATLEQAKSELDQLRQNTKFIGTTPQGLRLCGPSAISLNDGAIAAKLNSFASNEAWETFINFADELDIELVADDIDATDSIIGQAIVWAMLDTLSQAGFAVERTQQ